MSNEMQGGRTIYLVEDDVSVRTAIARLLTTAGYAVEQFASAADFLLEDLEQRAGCLVLDVCLPGPSGLQLQEALNRRQCALPIIFLTGHGDIPMSVRAIKAGAIDFLTKPVVLSDLVRAIEAGLASFQRYRELNEFKQTIQARLNHLSLREKQVLEEVMKGRLNKQIATTLGIAERTVKAHRAKIMQKMCVESVAELARTMAFIEGSTSLPDRAPS
jgi:FixJ family two-component response regulator